MEKIIQTNSFAETQKVGEAFASLLTEGDVLCLRGDLGAGKTTFMQGLAKGLGIKQRIISPTFIIVRTYKISEAVYPSSEQSESRSLEMNSSRQARTINTLYHIDLYRTETIADMESVGLSEILQQKDAIIAIEWAEKLDSLLPKKRWELQFTWLTEQQRKIEIRKVE